MIAVTSRYFLDHAAGWILELDRGEGIPWKGNYSSWLEQKTSAWKWKRKPPASAANVERELSGAYGSLKRSGEGKARLNSYDKLMNEDIKEKDGET